MRAAFVLIFGLLVGYGLLQIDQIDPNNYVKLYFGNYLVEVKLLGFLLGVLALVVVLYFVLRLLHWVWKSPKLFGRWRKQRNHDLAEQKLGAGYLSLIKGDWKRAEAQLVSKANYSAIPHVSYLAAAQAAQEQGKISKRDEYIKKAYECAPNERLAIGMTKARLHQAAGQIDQALATLHDLSDQGKRNAQYTAMLVQANQAKGDWQEVNRLLPGAKKQKALAVDTLDGIELEVQKQSLLDAGDIKLAWKALPRVAKKKAELVAVYAARLASVNDVVGAEKLIRNSLTNAWSDDLLSLYGSLQHAKPARTLRQVEGWMLARPENGLLSLVAGKLALAANKTEQAKNYLQDAIARGDYAEAYELLGSIYEKGSESGKAMELYRAGISRIAHPLDQLAAPTSESESDNQDRDQDETEADSANSQANEDLDAPSKESA
jgi:HemY protein